MRIYLDNCCFNRPYDSQSDFKILLETRAKLHVQEAIRCGKFEMIGSYMLEFENEQNTDRMKKKLSGIFNNVIVVSMFRLNGGKNYSQRLQRLWNIIFHIKMQPMLHALFMQNVTVC